MQDLYCKETLTAAIDEQTVHNMFELYSKYYADTNKQSFIDDLVSKNNAILIFENTKNSLVGFSVIDFYSREFENKQINVVYSGDTIIAQEYWGSFTLATQWLNMVTQFKKENPSYPLYWLLLSKGQRTYRYLSSYFKYFYPSINQEDNYKYLEKLSAYLAKDRFKELYCEKKKIVQFQTNIVSLKDNYHGLNERVKKLPEVKFFTQVNPGFREGDELVCVAEIAKDNMISRVHHFFE